MSRQRGYLTSDCRRLRNDIPVFQASEAEIQMDLKKLKYVKKIEPEPVEVVTKLELPKKRKAPVEDDKFVIDGLIKLMNTKPPEVKKKPVEVVEKKPEPAPKPNINQAAWMNMMAMQNQYMKNIMLASQFSYFPQIAYPTIKSSADYHLKVAKFIHLQKNSTKNNTPK
ncbi:hypothetical protein SteCoe_26576 [Stentor coeruleus]|uniref:Uncharacterized protein n=1 Tax=Stentor coeruleus TaxID=5963 RepID=A0A1R2BCK2_9CILI|nr:hypothetical protein SteCoe_26576 [Stentor coeruleus]